MGFAWQFFSTVKVEREGSNGTIDEQSRILRAISLAFECN